MPTCTSIISIMFSHIHKLSIFPYSLFALFSLCRERNRKSLPTLLSRTGRQRVQGCDGVPASHGAKTGGCQEPRKTSANSFISAGIPPYNSAGFRILSPLGPSANPGLLPRRDAPTVLAQVGNKRDHAEVKGKHLPVAHPH